MTKPNPRSSFFSGPSAPRRLACEHLEVRNLLCGDAGMAAIGCLPVEVPVDVGLAGQQTDFAAGPETSATTHAAQLVGGVGAGAAVPSVAAIGGGCEAATALAGTVWQGTKVVFRVVSTPVRVVRFLTMDPMGAVPTATTCWTCQGTYDSEFYPAHFNDDHFLLEDLELEEEDLQKEWPIQNTGQSVDPIANPDKFAYLHQPQEPAVCGTAMIDRPIGWHVDPLDAVFAQIQDVGYFTSDALDGIRVPR